jgi:hypothetical protein
VRHVLLISRNFAPTSHVSVERATKLARYLPEFGWQPTVLTGATPSSGLPQDPGLSEQVGGLDVLRARSPEFSWFYRRPGGRTKGAPALRSAPRRGAWHPKAWLLPDSQVLWYPFAVTTALRAASSARWEAVIATSFPPTAILVAHTVAARLGIPYVADFRDAWTTYLGAPRRPAPLAALERRLESRMMADAAAVVAVDGRMVADAIERLPEHRRPPVHLIPNGYDEADFAAARPRELPRFSIVHTGQLRRPPRPLWEALALVLRDRPDLAGRMHLWQIGFVDAAAAAELGAPPEGVTVHVVPPVTQREAIGYMLGADALLTEEFGTVMPSKTVQYLRAGRPILALEDAGTVLRETLRAAHQAHVVGRNETVRLAGIVARLADEPRGEPEPPGAAVTAYSRRATAERFAALLVAACDPTAARRREVGSRARRGAPAPANVALRSRP